VYDKLYINLYEDVAGISLHLACRELNPFNEINSKAIYNHSATYDQPKLRPKFPYENLNSGHYKNMIKILFRNTFLYFIEETLFLSFCNRKTIYLNPPLSAGGCVLHLISYFRLTTNFTG
jgi:hypothetical protein